MQVEAKRDIKKRLKRSPDRADALALAVYRADTVSGEIEQVGDDRVFGGGGMFSTGGVFRGSGGSFRG